MIKLPYGPGSKDGPWSWGSWLWGAAGFAVAWGILTWDLSGVLSEWGGQIFLLLLAGFLFSLPTGLAYVRGQLPPGKVKATVPAVDIRGKEGSTYVVLDPGKTGASRVKPKEFGPITWSLYSVFVRAPVAFGDFLLTTVWRGLRRSLGYARPTMRTPEETGDAIDYPEDLPQPDQQRF